MMNFPRLRQKFGASYQLWHLEWYVSIASYQSSITVLFVLQAMIGAVEDWEMSLGMYACWHHTYHACLLLNL